MYMKLNFTSQYNTAVCRGRLVLKAQYCLIFTFKFLKIHKIARKESPWAQERKSKLRNCKIVLSLHLPLALVISNKYLIYLFVHFYLKWHIIFAIEVVAWAEDKDRFLMHRNLNWFICSEMKDTNKIHKEIGVSRYCLLSEIKLINLVHFKNLRLIESFLSYSHFNHFLCQFLSLVGNILWWKLLFLKKDTTI